MNQNYNSAYSNKYNDNWNQYNNNVNWSVESNEETQSWDNRRQRGTPLLPDSSGVGTNREFLSNESYNTQGPNTMSNNSGMTVGGTSDKPVGMNFEEYMHPHTGETTNGRYGSGYTGRTTLDLNNSFGNYY